MADVLSVKVVLSFPLIFVCLFLALLYAFVVESSRLGSVLTLSNKPVDSHPRSSVCIAGASEVPDGLVLVCTVPTAVRTRHTIVNQIVDDFLLVITIFARTTMSVPCGRTVSCHCASDRAYGTWPTLFFPVGI